MKIVNFHLFVMVFFGIIFGIFIVSSCFVSYMKQCLVDFISFGFSLEFSSYISCGQGWCRQMKAFCRNLNSRITNAIIGIKIEQSSTEILVTETIPLSPLLPFHAFVSERLHFFLCCFWSKSSSYLERFSFKKITIPQKFIQVLS